VLKIGIAQNASAMARRGLIDEELDFENWPAMAIYRALALNHLVLHVDIRTSRTCVMVVSRPRHTDVALIAVSLEPVGVSLNSPSLNRLVGASLTSVSRLADSPDWCHSDAAEHDGVEGSAPRRSRR
jgi:hypothetical protein